MPSTVCPRTRPCVVRTTGSRGAAALAIAGTTASAAAPAAPPNTARRDQLHMRAVQAGSPVVATSSPPADPARRRPDVLRRHAGLEAVGEEGIAAAAAAFLAAIPGAIAAAEAAIAVGLLVLCSRTHSGGDAHAFAHEIFGTSGSRNAGVGGVMRSMVVLRHGD